MIKAHEGQVIDFGCCLVMAVKEEKRNACLGCFFDSVETFYINCSKLFDFYHLFEHYIVWQKKESPFL